MGNVVEVGKTDDLQPGQGMLVEVEGSEIALFNCDGTFYAIDNECTHVGGPLCEGTIEGDVVICPWHGAEFDIKTGDVVGAPAERPVRSYKVQVEGNTIKIEI